MEEAYCHGLVRELEVNKLEAGIEGRVRKF
jgi:hypothetical protein